MLDSRVPQLLFGRLAPKGECVHAIPIVGVAGHLEMPGTGTRLGDHAVRALHRQFPTGKRVANDPYTLGDGVAIRGFQVPTDLGLP